MTDTPMEEEYSDVDGDTIGIMKTKCLKKHIIDNSTLPTSTVQDILSSILNMDPISSLANKIFEVDKLRESLWNLFMLKIEDDSKYLTQRKLSYLNHTDFDGLTSFDWNCVLKEMLDLNPLLVDVLLAISTSRKKQHQLQHYKDIIPEFGLMYGILMKRRFKDLSRVQRTITVALSNEIVHQKV